MPQYKLIYFNTKGLGELIRYIFAQAGVEYEDKRVDREQEWPELKPNTPYGTLPVLEVDGKQLADSGVIARYLAEEFGLAGSNAFENADIASIVGVVNDIIAKMIGFYLEQDEARKADLKKALEEEHFPRYFGILEKRASGNNCADGWIYGAKVTLADLKIYSLLDSVLPLFPNALDNFPAIAKLKASVEQLPNIAKWLKDRPQTQN